MTEIERVKAEDERLAKERAKLERDGPKLNGAKLEARLERTWSRPRGFIGWLATVDHKEIGRRYIITALIFLALGGVLALAMRVQLAQLPDGGSFLCFARTVHGVAAHWGEPPPVYVVAMGCDIGRAGEVVYGDGLDLERAMVGIGLSCRLCDRTDCRSRAFPPLEHRLSLDPMVASDAPYRFEPPKKRLVS